MHMYRNFLTSQHYMFRTTKSSTITEIGLQLMLTSKIQLINQNGKT